VCGTGGDILTARTRAYAAIDALKAHVPPGTPLTYRSDIALPSATH